MWDDFKVGMEHILRWERVAVVTDVEWIRRAMRPPFGFLIPANLSVAPFDALVAAALKQEEAEKESELDHRCLRTLTGAMLECYRTLAGSPFPTDPQEQLAAAASAVFRSWYAPKAA